MSENQLTTSQQGERLSFFKLFSEKDYRVCVPIIQRDYAQGRSTTKEVRVNFLTALHDYLTEEIPGRDLDFVYGTIESDKKNGDTFVPLDGQQRLTTLFLLHWYLAQICDNDKVKESYFKAVLRNGKSRFTYLTRPSSTEFCDALMSHSYDMDSLLPPDKKLSNALSKTIRNSSWFYLSWRHDPTIQSMLTMLDAIHAQFHGENEKRFLALLIDNEKPIITFLFLDLGLFKLTDDLYIKMNSRGKPLTPFENFKAKYEQSLESVDLGKEKFQLEFDSETEEVSLSRYFSHKIDAQWANLLWQYKDIQNRENTPTDNTFDDEIMNFIRVVFTNRFAALNDCSAKAASDTLDYLRGAESARKLADYFDILSYHKYKEFKIAFDKDDEERIKNYPDGLFEIQSRKETAYGYALALVKSLDCLENGNDKIRILVSEPYQHYFNEDAIIRQVFGHNLDSHHARVCFHAYLRFLVENGHNLQGLDEWMRVVHNLSHPENTIMNEGREMANAIKAVELMLPHSHDILAYLKTRPSISGFSSWQLFEEIVKAHLITKGDAWKNEIETVEKHGYFNSQIGFILEFSGIIPYYRLHLDCNWPPEENEVFFQAFKEYSKKAIAVFNYTYEKRVNDKEFVFERAVFTKGNYIYLGETTKKNFLSTSTVAANVKRDNSWKRFLRVPETFDQNVRDKQELVKRVFDDSRFDAEHPQESVEQICKDRTGTWLDYLIDTPDMIGYCKNGFLQFWPDESYVILLGSSQLNHYHVDLYSYHLWKVRVEPNVNLFSAFPDKDPYAPERPAIRYEGVKRTDDDPYVHLGGYSFGGRLHSLNVFYSVKEGMRQYNLQFLATDGEPFAENIQAILDEFGFVPPEGEYKGVILTVDSEQAAFDKMVEFNNRLPFDLSC
ncbi:MAG: DUF262 domain-containing protein [Bacteroidales bacterium]|nr:DUF262 domain-containing protein [Bacteroidales bacterium]